MRTAFCIRGTSASVRTPATCSQRVAATLDLLRTSVFSTMHAQHIGPFIVVHGELLPGGGRRLEEIDAVPNARFVRFEAAPVRSRVSYIDPAAWQEDEENWFRCLVPWVSEREPAFGLV